MSRCLNLGCGPKWKEQYPDHEGLDIIDYEQKWIMPVASFLFDVKRYEKYDEVMANHFLEHFSQDELRNVFLGVHDLLKKKGTFKFVVPHMNKEKAWVLSHKTFWNETTCWWFGKDEARDTYGFGSWRVEEVIVNERKDIHVRLIKI